MTAPEADAAYKSMVREHLGPAVRAAGFKGSSGRWRRMSEAGDWAIVAVQKSRFADSDGIWFTVNLAVVSRPWWDWCNAYYGQHPAHPGEAVGYWRSRLRARVEPAPPPSTDWWAVRDAASAKACGLDAGQQLTDSGIPQLLAKLDRTAQLEAARAGRFQGVPRIWDQRVPLAVLLADHGPCAELDQLIAAFGAERGYDRLLDWLSGEQRPG